MATDRRSGLAQKQKTHSPLAVAERKTKSEEKTQAHKIRNLVTGKKFELLCHSHTFCPEQRWGKKKTKVQPHTAEILLRTRRYPFTIAAFQICRKAYYVLRFECARLAKNYDRRRMGRGFVVLCDGFFLCMSSAPFLHEQLKPKAQAIAATPSGE